MLHVRESRAGSASAGALAANREHPDTPVDVLQPQRRDLAGAQPEPVHQGEHRFVAQPGRAGWQRREQAGDLADAQRPGIVVPVGAATEPTQ